MRSSVAFHLGEERIKMKEKRTAIEEVIEDQTSNEKSSDTMLKLERDRVFGIK